MGGATNGTTVHRSGFGVLPGGSTIDRWRLDDGKIQVTVLTYGAILQEIVTPDRDGAPADVALGFDDLAGYLAPQPYLGAVIGRFANRIAGGRFDLNGRTYHLEANHRGQHLHGGRSGFDRRVWQAQPIDGSGVRLSLTSPDGDEGYPARLEAVVEYTLTGGELTIGYTATNAEPEGGPDTVLNLTNHVYLNLAGHASGEIGDQVVEIPAERYARSDAELIPTGEIASVEGTPLDLRPAQPFSAGWDCDFDQVVNAGGYDHSWLLADTTPGRLVPAARIKEPVTGRALEVHTDQPAVHLYSGNMMPVIPGAKGGQVYGRRGGFCVETQHLPDSPHHPNFPTTVLHPQQTFRSTTVFRFLVS